MLKSKTRQGDSATEVVTDVSAPHFAENQVQVQDASVTGRQFALASASNAGGTPSRPLVPVMIKIADIIKRPPFSTVLPINPDTKDLILVDMKEKGWDGCRPCDIWKNGNELILLDGHTRVECAAECNIEEVPAFIHWFATEVEALGFAIMTQIRRRNLKDGQLVALIKIYDEKVKPCEAQARAANGKFKPKASNEANGKSAAKTAGKLGTSTTTIERARFVIEHGSFETKRALGENKITLHRAWDKTRKEREETKKAEPQENRSKGKGKLTEKIAGTAPTESFPIALTTHSTLVAGKWSPVVMERADIPADPSKSQDEVKYTVDENALVIVPSKETLRNLPNRRIEVSPRFDLFDPAVPTTSITRVLATATATTDFQFLFTTRNPARLEEFPWSENTFVGVSVSTQVEVDEAEEVLDKINGAKRVIVVEQLTNSLKFKELTKVDWLVVRNSSKLPNPAPSSPILKLILKQAWAANCPVFFESGIVCGPEDVPANTSPVPSKEGTKMEGKVDE